MTSSPLPKTPGIALPSVMVPQAEGAHLCGAVQIRDDQCFFDQAGELDALALQGRAANA